jgi:hypothetical protein
MSVPVIYVCGPMSGYEDYNWPSFRAATSQLRKLGYVVRCPTESGASFELSWAECLRLSLRLMLDCDALALLPGWEESRGAAEEIRLARTLKMTVRPLTYWVSDDAVARHLVRGVS